MKVITIVVVFVAFVAVTNAGGPGKVIMCYYQASPDWPLLAVNQLKDADKCTHMIYWYISALPEGNLDVNDTSLQEFSTLKELNPNMKLMFTVLLNLDFKPNNDSYSVKPQDLVQNVKNLLEKYNLDGVDLEWRDLDSADSNITQLIRDLKATLLESNKILTFTAFHEEQSNISRSFHEEQTRIISRSYNITEMSNYLDYVIIIAYRRTKGEHQFELITALSEVEKSIEGLLEDGADPEKLVWGTVLFGISNKVGRVGYNEICRKIKSKGYNRTFSEQEKYPTIEKYGERIVYDDKESLKLKAGLVNERNLGGVAMQFINLDDTENECGDGKFPILNALSEGLNGIISVN